MDLVNLFYQSGTASTLIYLSLVALSGILIGKIKFFNIKLGVAGVLFAGLFFGQLGADPNHEVLHFLKEFGLILFIYSIGVDVGPRFVSSLKNNGLKLNILASGIVVLGMIVAFALKVILDIPTSVIVGVLSGAVTNTPSLGAAQQVISEQLGDANGAALTGMGYAVAYPFGIIGTILAMIIIRSIFHIKVKNETEKFQEELSGLSSGKLEAINLKIINPALIGKTVEFMQNTLHGEFVLSRIWRKGEFFMPNNNTILEENDLLYGVSIKTCFDSLELKVGPLQNTGDIEVTGNMAMRHVVFTNKDLAGKTIKQIGISRRFPVAITRIFRAGMEILPDEKDSIEFGDTIRIVGKRNSLDEVANLLGNSMHDLSHPNIFPVMFGILLGVLVGSIPFSFPGLPAPAKLGLAGGPLLVALFLGYKGRIGKLNVYMAPAANLFIRELGIILFLACVGLSSGGGFIETIADGGYMWMIYGALITAIPVLIIGFISLKMKINYLTVCGMIAGAMTDPPALEFANSMSPVQAQSTAYATVYPLVMFLRVLLIQIAVLVFI